MKASAAGLFSMASGEHWPQGMTRPAQLKRLDLL
jgi:hypothetical protein